VHSKRGIIEFGLGRRLMVEMVEAVGAPRQCRRQPGRPVMVHAGRNVADAYADPPAVALVRVSTGKVPAHPDERSPRSQHRKSDLHPKRPRRRNRRQPAKPVPQHHRGGGPLP
jgi:hypothetical protein